MTLEQAREHLKAMLANEEHMLNADEREAVALAIDLIDITLMEEKQRTDF